MFVVGSGAIDLLQGSAKSVRGGHSFFEADLISPSRTIELPDPTLDLEPNPEDLYKTQSGRPNFYQPWNSHPNLPRVIDLFQDGSLYLVDAPGHLPGHINLLANIGNHQSVYLAGDACHDRRILRQEKQIGTWSDSEGYTCCIHSNREMAEQTIDRIRKLEQQGTEVIFAHDVEWERDPNNKRRFWGSDT